MNRRGFFTTILFAALALFVRRKTLAKSWTQSPLTYGKPIPQGLIISQVCGRGKPFYPQDPIPTQKLRVTTEPTERVTRSGPKVSVNQMRSAFHKSYRFSEFLSL